MNDAIDVRGVSKRFGEVRAVNDINFTIPVGSLCGFLGPNGAGKSTTIRMIMSIIYPDSGSITVLGGSALDQKDSIGYLPEERGLYRKMRVNAFLRYIARLKGVPSRGLNTRITEWLERMELPGVEKRRCQELSKGMQQKVQFIASVIHDPDLIILDEPFSGLDPVNARLLGQVIREMSDAGKTIIFSTHVLHQAERLCDRVLMINQGKIVLDDNLTSIRRKHDPRTVLVDPIGPCAPLLTHAGDFPDVVTMEQTPDAETVEIHLEPGTPTSDGVPREMLEQIVSIIPVRSIELRRPTLDDVFVELVGTTIAQVEEQAS